MSAPTRILQRHNPSNVLRSTRCATTSNHHQHQHQPQPLRSSPSQLPIIRRNASSLPPSNSIQSIPPITSDQQNNLSPVWFSANFPLQSNLGTDPDKPPDDRKVKLGKTLRILQDRLPSLLQTPLPQEVLSPNITLHLFPSTHPHLPTVTGRMAYIAALWSSPIAWNRVPIIGNVKLEILSERMVKQPPVYSVPRRSDAVGEQLVVRWRTVGKGKNWGLPFINNGGQEGTAGEKKGEVGSETKAPVGMAQAVGSSKEFTGLFIFDFDKEGRILSHTIEHVQEGGQWEKGVGAKVVGLTDWLLGGMKGGDACPAFSRKDIDK